MSLSYCIAKALEMPYVRNQQRHFAIIVDKRGRIVSSASNSYTKTSTVMAKAAKRVGLECKVFCHAEQLALVRSKGKGYKIYVARVLSDGSVGNSEPCPVCALLLSESHIKEVEHT
jgi:deoxycytidylate deaminase